MWKAALARRLQSRTGISSLFHLNGTFHSRPPILGRLRGHIPHKRDASNFTKTPGDPPNPAKSNKSVYAFALGSVFSGALVYYLASTQRAGFGAQSAIPSTKSGLNEQYGTPEDFQTAIREFRSTFVEEDTVSTDADVLEVHGFSENDYHPGGFSISFIGSLVMILTRRVLRCIVYWDVTRFISYGRSVPSVYRRCRQDSQDSE